MNDIEATLPVEADKREAAVDQVLYDRAARFLSTHTVELSMPEEISRSFDEGNYRHFSLDPKLTLERLTLDF